MLGRSTATPGNDTSSHEWVAAIKSPRQLRNLPLLPLPQLVRHCLGMERVMGIEPIGCHRMSNTLDDSGPTSAIQVRHFWVRGALGAT